MSSTTTIDPETVTRDRAEILQTRRELTVSSRTGLLTPKDLSEALEFSQAMAKAGTAVPSHLRGSPGACLAIIELAAAWELMAYSVANQSYVVKDRLCFMGQLVHAVIKKRVPLKYPALGLETRYEGDGPTRKVIVFAEVIVAPDGTSKVLEWESPVFKDIEPKNSPLWTTDPDQQLFYRTTSRWQRRYFPEIMLGVYTKDEIEDMTEDARAEWARDVTPETSKGTGIATRLPGKYTTEGFRPENGEPLGPTISEDELANIAADVPEGKQQPETPTVRQETRQESVQGSGDADPKPKPKAKEKAPEPRNTEQYIDYLKAWLAATADDARVHDRYSEEKDLRGRCGVMGEELQACHRLKNERIAALGGA